MTKYDFENCIHICRSYLVVFRYEYETIRKFEKRIGIGLDKTVV